MGLMDFALRRAVPAVGVAGVAAWAGATTINDDWDDCFCPSFAPRFVVAYCARTSNGPLQQASQRYPLVRAQEWEPAG